MIKFEKVKKFADVDFNLPVRKTSNSAGYDFEVAEDIVIPPMRTVEKNLLSRIDKLPKVPTLVDMARYTKDVSARPTLVSTGVKCYLDKGKKKIDLDYRINKIINKINCMNEEDVNKLLDLIEENV